MRCWVGLLCLSNRKDECGILLFKVSRIYTYMAGYQWRIWYPQNMDTSQCFECLKPVKTIWQNRVGLRDVWLSLCSTSTRLTIIMWWAWNHGSKHRWFVWIVGSTDAGHWIADVPMKNNADYTMKARFFLLWFENHNIWLQHLHIILFLFQILIFFVWSRFSFKVIIACTKGTIKILNVMVFILSTLYIHIWIQNI
jgi:hypothetical protein